MTVLVGFDNTPCGQDALGLARLLSHLTGEPILVAAIWPGDETGIGHALQDVSWVADQRQRAQQMLDAARALLDGHTDADFQVVGPASASRGLHDLAEDRAATVIVAGSSSDTMMGRLGPGSTGERLLHGSPCPVAIAPRGYRFGETAPSTVHTIAVAYVDTDEGRDALRAGAAIARTTNAALRVLTVVDPPEQQVADRITEQVARLCPDTTASVELLHGRDAAAALAEASLQDVDILVCGSRGYGPLRSVLLGGVSRRLVKAAGCPLLVVPRGVNQEVLSGR